MRRPFSIKSGKEFTSCSCFLFSSRPLAASRFLSEENASEDVLSLNGIVSSLLV